MYLGIFLHPVKMQRQIVISSAVHFRSMHEPWSRRLRRGIEDGQTYRRKVQQVKRIKKEFRFVMTE